jgi:hypothetical protein
MGKKLVFDYTFDASAKTITVNDIYPMKRWQLISNITDNVVIYQFNDPAFGISDISFDYPNSKTTVTLVYDTTSMSDTDELQIFIDEGTTDVTVNDRFIDPVSKIRVSNPENLIDTDFEYGLQSTKWETLELTANIPTFFSRSGDFDIEITSMTVSAGSDIVQVTTGIDHALQRGSPIIIQGSGNVAADGGFVVGSVISDTVFNYKAKNTFLATGDLKEEFTQLFPGSVYAGTEFKLSSIGGIVTDEAAESELTVTTEYPTDFETGTAMALANTFAKAEISFDTDNVTVDNTESVDIQRLSATATGETSDFLVGGVSEFNAVPEHALYFREGSTHADSLTISGTNITFPYEHGLSNLQLITYICSPDTNTPMTGTGGQVAVSDLNCRTYFAYVINATTIRLQTWVSTSSFYTVTPSYGTDGGVSKSAFIKTDTFVSYYRGRFTYAFQQAYGATYNRDGLSPYGLYTTSTTNNRVFFTNSNRSGYSSGHDYTFEVSDPIDNLNYSFSSYDYWMASTSTSLSNTYMRAYFNSGNSSYVYNRSSRTGYIGINSIEESNRKSSLYYPDHGIENGDIVQVSAEAGTLPSQLSAGYYVADVLSDDRIAFKTTGGSEVRFRTGGSADLEYRLRLTKVKDFANTIQIPGTTLNDGDALTYDINGGTALGGLTDGTTYYVAGKVGDRFYLSTTQNPFGDSATYNNFSSTATVDLTNNTITGTSNPFTNGDTVILTAANPPSGYNNGRIYWVRTISGNEVALYNSSADAVADTNRVDIFGIGSGNGTLQKYNIIDITSSPASSETQKFTADFVGAADGNYEIASVSDDQLSFTFDAGSKIEARTKTVTSQESFVADENAFYVTDHGFITGDSVAYTSSGTTNLSGLTSGTTYYVIALNKDFFSLASSESNAVDGTAIALSETGSSSTELTGTFSFQPTTIVGRFNGTGTVSFDASQKILTGELTTFTSYFNKGDAFEINEPETTLTTAITAVDSATDVFTATGHGLTDGDPIRFTGTSAPANIDFGKIYFAAAVSANTFSVHFTRTDALADSNLIQLSTTGTSVSVNGMTDTGSIIERTIDYVNSDSQMEFTEDLPSTALSDVNYLQRTSLLLRPDGFALHRPYDGGVELIPPTNPDSQMIRQTRKYFRYQSGKGIQVSFAVNFSPTSQIDTFTRSGTTGTITTRFPHRLTAGLNITTTGATNANSDFGTDVLTVTVVATASGNVYYVDGYEQDTLTFYEGRTYRFDMSDSSATGHPLYFSETEDGTHNSGTKYTTGVTDNYSTNAPGSSGSYIEITVATDAPTLYTYCENHSGMGFQVNTPVDPDNNQGSIWNGTHQIASIVDDYRFTVTLPGTPNDISANGLVEYYVNGWNNSSLRCGLFDDQNGLYFEYDGDELKCCRRSSIRQLSGYASVTFRSGNITGVNTKFASQLSKGDYVVIKGQTYVITKIDSDTLMSIAPSYRGVTAEDVVITKTEDTKIAQTEWNLDVCDGTGYTGFNLDIHKIQMAYIDYSWYGAGKVRFGFKDQHGDVRYVHSFVHGNFFTEAYMRSGNIPARYEIQNIGTPTYVPALAHWGTSVIMDGRFDSDRAYIFNATSNSLALTGASQLTADAKAVYTGLYYQRQGFTLYPIGYAIELDAGDAALNNTTKGTVITGADLAANTSLTNPSSGVIQPQQPYLPSILCRQGTSRNTEAVRNLLLIDKQLTGTSGSSSTYNIGAASGDDIAVTKELPLISVRLAPSVDSSAPGFLGEREIVNRMQLILNSVGILSTHACTIRLILNGQISSNEWERVNNPSLSQLINHTNQDTISGGLSIYNFEAQGGTGTSGRQPVLTTEELGEVATLGNAIMGGDNVFPDGPDVVTLTAVLNEDPSTVSSSNPFIVSGRISWSESQA